ncbi:epimerase [Actinoplanes sp. CA-030573]|uniref:epimerase n=1 Tax=Actinoplanes sp. CA-030573 TaxID=3239898 RepID=UPI003D8CCE54
MKVIIFGATGMVGQGVLRESLLAADVEEVLAVVRTPTGVRHPKLREVRTDDFTDFTTISLKGYDACFYCLGVSSVGMDEAAYTRVSYELPMAAARAVDHDACFIYVSGAGTSATSRQMWARVKARTEREIIELLPNGYAARPGIIQPTHGVRSKTRLYNAIYTVAEPLFPLVERVAPKYVTSTDRLGRAMLQVARVGFPRHILENADLR